MEDMLGGALFTILGLVAVLFRKPLSRWQLRNRSSRGSRGDERRLRYYQYNLLFLGTLFFFLGLALLTGVLRPVPRGSS